MTNILITGGAGYIGSVLTNKLIKQGVNVTVLDLMLYGENVFNTTPSLDGKLSVIKGDIRDKSLLKHLLRDIDAIVHLACISNDPSFELNPSLGKSINFDSMEPLVSIAANQGVKRFIYASSSSVYGIQEIDQVTENVELKPLTDYSKYKALCEEILLKKTSESFTTTIVRPATVSGLSSRQRLDVIVNILTNHAFHRRRMDIFGGEQRRPNIHIDDMTDLYISLLDMPEKRINGKIYNWGNENYKVNEIASIVKKIVGQDVITNLTHSDDLRSYSICSEKIKKELKLKPQKTLEDAVSDLVSAFKMKLFPNSLTDKRYFNIKTMQEAKQGQYE